jgi:hypothetical protein
LTQWPGSTTEILARRERDYMLGRCRVRMKSSIDNLEVGDYPLGNLREGQPAEVPRWVAEELVEMKLAESQEEPFEVEAFRALSKEKMMGPLQLSALQADFYLRMRRRLAMLGASVEDGRTKKEEADRLKATCYDLVGIRLSKLLSLSSSATSSSSLEDRLTPEETAFFSLSQALSKEWRAALLGGAK